MEETFRRCWEFICGVQDRGARQLATFERGTAIYNEDLPRVHDANLVRVERGFDEVTASELIVQVEALQAPARLHHRKVLVPDEAAGERLAPAMARFGYRSSRLLVMAYGGPLERPGPAPQARHLAAAELRPVRDEASRELLRPASHDAIPQLRAYHELTASVVPTRFIAAPVNGEVGSYCMLLRMAGVAQIEEVTTLRRHRGRRLGTAVVESALRAALAGGDDLVFIVAAEHDWPREWYGRMGFHAVGRIHQFLRG